VVDIETGDVLSEASLDPEGSSIQGDDLDECSSGIRVWAGPIRNVRCVLDIPKSIGTVGGYPPFGGQASIGGRESSSTALIPYCPPQTQQVQVLTGPDDEIPKSPRIELIEEEDNGPTAENGAMMELD